MAAEELHDGSLAAAGIAQVRYAGLHARSDPVRRAAMASFLQRRMEVLVVNGITAPPA
jgi:hypothetical protein